MGKKLDKYKTLLEFLNIIAPGENFINLQMAEADFVVNAFHKAVKNEYCFDRISPEALAFVKQNSEKILKNLEKFLKKLQGAEFYNCEENGYWKVLRSEITSFLSLFERDFDPDVVKFYINTASVYYGLLK